MKICFKCGIAKEIDKFYVHPQMADGHLGKCKECCKIDERLRRIEHPELVAACEKRRNRSAEATIMARNWRAKNPEKYHAHNILYAAVRDGKLIKPDACEICGSKFHIHAHHTDYSKPLEVVWLCAKCHGQIQ
jgi:hypothetical protein